MFRKTLVSLTIVGAALVANPFNHADAAPRDEARACVNKARTARTQAQNKFRQAIRDARELPREQQQAAVQTAQEAYRQAAQKANSDFVACIQAIDTGQ